VLKVCDLYLQDLVTQ